LLAILLLVRALKIGNFKMEKVILNGHIIVPDEDLTAVQSELATHIALTRQENGCIVFNVTPDINNVNKFNVYEEFSDKESFSAHQVRVKSSKWGSVTRSVERHYEVTGLD
jgi:quinol monooxygenase YgiN